MIGNIISEGSKLKHQFIIDYITPITFGIETVGGLIKPLTYRNTMVPSLKKMNFTTYKDDQESVLIRVYAGERMISKYSSLIYELVLDGLQKAPKGVPQIEISFETDSECLVSLIVKEYSSGKKRIIKLDNCNFGFTEEQLENIIQEAEIKAEEDQKEIEKIKQRFDLIDDNLLKEK